MLSNIFKRKNTLDAVSAPVQQAKPYDGPVDLLITGAQLVTMDAHNRVIMGGGLAVHAGKIVEIAEDHGLALLRERAGEVIQAHGQIVIPGLINTHCHAGDSLFRGLIEGLALEPWLEKLWVAESAILTPEAIKLGSMLGYAENLLCGVTTVMDMFWHPAQLVAAADAVGIRVATGGIFFDPPGIDGLTREQREGAAKEFFKTHADHPSLIKTICAHGAYTVSAESLTIAQMIQDSFGALLTIHAAETRAEQKTVEDNYGRSVIRHLDELGLLTERTILAHCVHIDDEEIDLIAASGATVSHNPASNLKLGSGIARVPVMRDKGVRIALGTDGAVSGNDLDMWKSIRLAATLHNGYTENPTAVNAQDSIGMATIEGARALCIADETGSLEIGKRADFAIMDPHQVHSVPMFDPLHYLGYSASHNDVRHVYAGGDCVVRDRTLTKIDLDTVLDDVTAMIPAIRKSLEGAA